MARKNIKEEVKKPDIVVTTVATWIAWAKANPKPVVVSGAALVLAIGLVLGFWLYENRKNERAQYLLSQGLKAYQEYVLAGQQDSLPKAEATFKELLRENPKGLNHIALIYLGKISRAQNRGEEARIYYTRAAQESKDPLIKKSALSALQELAGSK